MDHDLRELIGKIIEIYNDSLTIFSKDRKDHIHHLRHIFNICKKYGISLNPNKSIFGVDEKNFPGNIISKEGVNIYPTRIESIHKVPLHDTKRAM
jgi:hypothetical protein